MNKKIEALYVASRVAHLEYETNPWIQYESFGEVEHRIYVSPKKELIYSVIEDGITKYYLYPSHQEIEESTFKVLIKLIQMPLQVFIQQPYIMENHQQ